MNKFLLDEEVQAFINNNLGQEVPNLILNGIPFSGDLTVEVIEQIKSKKRSEIKLPTWFHTSEIYFPKSLSIEQSSSEITASYKAGLVSGKTLIDLTGGMGVDSYYFSKTINKVFYCELQSDLAEISAYNFTVLNRENITCFNEDGILALKRLDQPFDWIYLDPARRDENDKKVFLLSQCTPNIKTFQGLFFKYSNKVMIKTSPLLDISAAIDELEFPKELHIIAVKNEVKELVWILEKEYAGDLLITTVNISQDNTQEFSFYFQEEHSAIARYGQPQTYLYEPNASILKSGAFNLLSASFKVLKLNKHSHLYTSDVPIDFPGRLFKIDKVIPFQKKSILKERITKANITTRNFPLSVNDIRKKFKIKDGGSSYLFFTTNITNDKVVLKCSKL